MQNDHVFYDRLGGAIPSPAEIERSMAEARRMRSEAVHEYLVGAIARVREALGLAPAPKGPVGQCC
jgi:hypothetical protein